MLIIRCPKCGAKKEVQTCYNAESDKLENDCGRCSYAWKTQPATGRSGMTVTVRAKDVKLEVEATQPAQVVSPKKKK